MNCLNLTRHQIILQPESARVIIRPFIPSSSRRLSTIIGRALALTEEEVEKELTAVRADFDSRHFDIEPVLMSHFARVQSEIFTQRPLTAHGSCSLVPSSPANTRWRPPRCSIHPSSRILIRADVPGGWVALHHEPPRHGRRAHFLHRIPRGHHRSRRPH